MRWFAKLSLALLAAPCARADEPAPLMRDLMGLNPHTVLFRPEVYQPVAVHLRDYHGMKWEHAEGGRLRVEVSGSPVFIEGG